MKLIVDVNVSKTDVEIAKQKFEKLVRDNRDLFFGYLGIKIEKSCLTTSDCARKINSKFRNVEHKMICTKREVYIMIKHGGKIKIGNAKCKKCDTFNYNVGEALAICRAMKWNELEDELLESLREGCDSK